MMIRALMGSLGTHAGSGGTGTGLLRTSVSPNRLRRPNEHPPMGFKPAGSLRRYRLAFRRIGVLRYGLAPHKLLVERLKVNGQLVEESCSFYRFLDCGISSSTVADSSDCLNSQPSPSPTGRGAPRPSSSWWLAHFARIGLPGQQRPDRLQPLNLGLDLCDDSVHGRLPHARTPEATSTSIPR
jgi:hypothetical protein